MSLEEELRPHYTRAPSVEEYERLTRRERLAAAELLYERMVRAKAERADLDRLDALKALRESQTEIERIHIDAQIVLESCPAEPEEIVSKRRRDLVADAARWVDYRATSKGNAA